MSTNHDMNEASMYFNANWQRYKESVNKNVLYHREMFQALNQFLVEHMSGRDFSFVDVGCGDSSSIAPVLFDKPIKKYIGIDEADNVLQMASSTLAHLNCEKEFIAENMKTAIKHISNPVDIIFTSYAVHHLSSQEKFEFIADCKEKLNSGGYLLMVDGVLEMNQTRDEWLDALEARINSADPQLPQDEIKFRMEHPRADDYPEKIEVFDGIAKKQAWKNFQVLVNKGIFAFMAFAK